jgi:hypothetical protein
MRRANIWTDEQIQYLRENYSHKNIEGICEFLGRSKRAVIGKASELRLCPKNKWKDWEVNAVREAYVRAGIDPVDMVALCALLGRDRTTITGKASELGLTSTTRRKKVGGAVDKRKFKGDAQALSRYLSEKTLERYAEGRHPRGMLGKKHTAETRRIIGEKSQAKWSAMSERERQEQLDKAYATRKSNGFAPPKAPARGSWAAGWRDVGGRRIYMRSRWEANYAHYLQWLLDRGEIASWEYEPKTFWFEAIKRGVRSYKPDFLVRENNGHCAWHEVKGWMDARSKTTLRRMTKYYPEETVKVIDAKAYRAIRKFALGLVPGWEDSERDARI